MKDAANTEQWVPKAKQQHAPKKSRAKKKKSSSKKSQKQPPPKSKKVRTLQHKLRLIDLKIKKLEGSNSGEQFLGLKTDREQLEAQILEIEKEQATSGLKQELPTCGQGRESPKHAKPTISDASVEDASKGQSHQRSETKHTRRRKLKPKHRKPKHRKPVQEQKQKQQGTKQPRPKPESEYHNPEPQSKIDELHKREQLPEREQLFEFEQPPKLRQLPEVELPEPREPLELPKNCSHLHQCDIYEKEGRRYFKCKCGHDLDLEKFIKRLDELVIKASEQDTVLQLQFENALKQVIWEMLRMATASNYMADYTKDVNIAAFRNATAHAYETGRKYHSIIGLFNEVKTRVKTFCKKQPEFNALWAGISPEDERFLCSLYVSRVPLVYLNEMVVFANCRRYLEKISGEQYRKQFQRYFDPSWKLFDEDPVEVGTKELDDIAAGCDDDWRSNIKQFHDLRRRNKMYSRAKNQCYVYRKEMDDLSESEKRIACKMVPLIDDKRRVEITPKLFGDDTSDSHRACTFESIQWRDGGGSRRRIVDLVVNNIPGYEEHLGIWPFTNYGQVIKMYQEGIKRSPAEAIKLFASLPKLMDLPYRYGFGSEADQALEYIWTTVKTHFQACHDLEKQLKRLDEIELKLTNNIRKKFDDSQLLPHKSLHHMTLNLDLGEHTDVNDVLKDPRFGLDVAKCEQVPTPVGQGSFSVQMKPGLNVDVLPPGPGTDRIRRITRYYSRGEGKEHETESFLVKQCDDQNEVPQVLGVNKSYIGRITKTKTYKLTFNNSDRYFAATCCCCHCMLIDGYPPLIYGNPDKSSSANKSQDARKMKQTSHKNSNFFLDSSPRGASRIHKNRERRPARHDDRVSLPNNRSNAPQTDFSTNNSTTRRPWTPRASQSQNNRFPRNSSTPRRDTNSYDRNLDSGGRFDSGGHFDSGAHFDSARRRDNSQLQRTGPRSQNHEPDPDWMERRLRAAN